MQAQCPSAAARSQPAVSANMDFQDVIMKRVDGLRGLLAAEGDAAKREELSKSQTHVLKALVCKLDCTDPKFKTFAKDFVEKICDMASLMRQADQDELVLCIADLTPTKKCSTWVMQNYSSVFSFWTEAE